MNTDILNGILIFGILQSLFFGLLFLRKRNKSLPDIILGFWLIIISIQTAIILLSQYKTYEIGFNLEKNFSIILAILHGPLLYLYINKIIYANKVFIWKDIAHFGMFFIAGLLLLFSAPSPLITNILIPLLGILSGIVYCILSLITLIKHRKQIPIYFSYSEKISLNWILKLISGFMAIWFGVTILVILSKFFHYNISMNRFFTIVPLFIFYISYHGFIQKVIYSVHERTFHFALPDVKARNSKRDTYKKSGLPTEKMKSIQKKLIDLMQVDKLYLEPTLSLSELSENLNIPVHHITQTLNEYSGVSFYNFINRFRVNEFKEKIKQNNTHPIIGVAYECGFNSKASFNRIFKQIEEQTPSEFRKQLNYSS